MKEKDEYGAVKTVIKQACSPSPGNLVLIVLYRPFIIDLESTNGTIVNEEKIPTSRYYELMIKDGMSFLFSTPGVTLKSLCFQWSNSANPRRSMFSCVTKDHDTVNTYHSLYNILAIGQRDSGQRCDRCHHRSISFVSSLRLVFQGSSATEPSICKDNRVALDYMHGCHFHKSRLVSAPESFVFHAISTCFAIKHPCDSWPLSLSHHTAFGLQRE